VGGGKICQCLGGYVEVTRGFEGTVLHVQATDCTLEESAPLDHASKEELRGRGGDLHNRGAIYAVRWQSGGIEDASAHVFDEVDAVEEGYARSRKGK
jgi:predicted metal-dependent phosphoesterase TrpH